MKTVIVSSISLCDLGNKKKTVVQEYQQNLHFIGS